MKIDDLRREYGQMGLSRDSLEPHPFQQFEKWLNQAIDADITDPTGMILATSNRDGRISQRTVLLKELDNNGFIFFTNYKSAKSQAIAQQPQVSLIFPWLALERQVEISGVAEKISIQESTDYFQSRPRSSQLGAWASRQSTSISNRKVLTNRLKKLEERYQYEDIPIPDFWGGYRVIPDRIEFWQGRVGRLHDRFEYVLSSQGWEVNRLSP